MKAVDIYVCATYREVGILFLSILLISYFSELKPFSSVQ